MYARRRNGGRCRVWHTCFFSLPQAGGFSGEWAMKKGGKGGFKKP